MSLKNFGGPKVFDDENFNHFKCGSLNMTGQLVLQTVALILKRVVSLCFAYLVSHQLCLDGLVNVAAHRVAYL